RVICSSLCDPKYNQHSPIVKYPVTTWGYYIINAISGKTYSSDWVCVTVLGGRQMMYQPLETL
ncbi:MAG: hypothetical protein KGJ80_22445, partial [Chloroflexota bacterium]|nr:hypothetical protein [Chloroflexota bacterium]